jgi:thioredoxin reductase (NADPH)
MRGKQERVCQHSRMEGRRALILAVDTDPEGLAATQRELRKRYVADYDVVCAASGEAAIAELERAAQLARPVAVVLADRSVAIEELFGRCRELHPTAKRLLLVTPTDTGANTVIVRVIGLGLVDGVLPKPLDLPAEQFHRAVVESLDEWVRSAPAGGDAFAGRGRAFVEIIGARWAHLSHELRDVLSRASVPHSFADADAVQGRERLHELGLGSERLPVVVVYGRVLVEPTIADIADALGASAEPGHATYDVTIIGAGPAGMAGAVYAASEGHRTLVVEQGTFGGQAGASSLIRNYLGFPHGVRGEELARRAYVQAVHFGAKFVFGREVTAVRTGGAGLDVVLGGGSVVRTRTCVLASGVAWRRLGVPELEERVGAGVFYGAAAVEAPALAGEQVYVVGGGNSAGQAALHLARFAQGVTVLVRGDSLEDTMSGYLIGQLAAAPNVRVRVRTAAVGGGGHGRLEQLVLEDRESGDRETVAAAALFVLIGAEPGTEWLAGEIACDEQGYILTGRDVGDRWPLERPPEMLETSLPGLFAAGDVRHGSAKRVAGAVGDGALAIQLCHRYVAMSDGAQTPA